MIQRHWTKGARVIAEAAVITQDEDVLRGHNDGRHVPLGLVGEIRFFQRPIVNVNPAVLDLYLLARQTDDSFDEKPGPGVRNLEDDDIPPLWNVEVVR
jgi:hypothetical protein